MQQGHNLLGNCVYRGASTLLNTLFHKNREGMYNYSLGIHVHFALYYTDFAISYQFLWPYLSHKVGWNSVTPKVNMAAYAIYLSAYIFKFGYSFFQKASHVILLDFCASKCCQSKVTT